MSNTKKRSRKGGTQLIPMELFEEESFLVSELPRLRDTAVGEEYSLQFLDSLRGKKGERSFFLPKSLFVRQEMLQIWDELSTHTQDERVKSQALIGSPGVGKSVLFFLYALHLAKESDKKVMYWRKATEDTKHITLFCLDSKVQDGVSVERSVRIRFCNKIPYEHHINDIYVEWMQAAYPELFEDTGNFSGLQMGGHVSDLLMSHVVMFADGPKHADKHDTKYGGMDYLCSSGGHPLPKNDQTDALKVVVLCGRKSDPFAACLKCFADKERVLKIWDEEIGLCFNDGTDEEEENEAVEMEVQVDQEVPVSHAEGNQEVAHAAELYTFAEKLEDVVDLIYYYTGGRISDALKLLRGQKSFQVMKYDIFSLKNGLPEGAVDLAMHGKYGTKDTNSFDRLRTYFVVENSSPLQHIQIVDSGYALSLLENREMASKYLDAYKEAVKMTEMTIAGLNFEQMMHKVFIRLAQAGSNMVPFSGHVKATGTTLEGVRQIEKEKYWIPSVPNFPSIDAAVIDDGGSIVGVQYFAGKRHGFKERAYKCSFLNHIPGTLNANKDNPRIVHVVPSDQQERRNDTTNYPSKVVIITCDTMMTVMEDAPNVFK